ncbi:hypothetical protein CCACVL1_16030 [Corchorus capsularis]|uniref:Uncharacterized protein n=1 Tax=Corchorus capsularis TaxID=210143 RepID=A0A1R3HZQ9_COCAP|nr:hypothetical protein CCACVL1_16030 [Corchorus capsularis]
MVEVEAAVKAAMLVFKERGNNAVAVEYLQRELRLHLVGGKQIYQYIA